MQPSDPHHDAPAKSPAHILLVDDDAEIGALVSRYFGSQGLRVSVAGSAGGMRTAMEETRVDVVLLDLGLPDGEGLDLLRELRERWRGPLIIVSGRGESVERVVGLELGADDYVTKPFDLRELLARVRSVLRRASEASATPPGETAQGYEFAGMRLETPTRRLTRPGGEVIDLTSGEFELLLVLLRRSHQVLTRDQLMTATHGREAGPYDRAIDVQIGRLRRKLESDPTRPQLIKSIRGAGYLFAPPVTPF